MTTGLAGGSGRESTVSAAEPIEPMSSINHESVRDKATCPAPAPLLRRMAVPLAIVLLALIIRVPLMVGFGLPLEVPGFQPQPFGGEEGNVARSLVEGHGFNSPLAMSTGDTGPTAIVSPLYVFVLAGIFSLFGTFSVLSASVALLLNCGISALTCLPVMGLWRCLFGDRGTVAAGVGWAILPYAAWFPAYVVQENTLAALMFSCIVLIAVTLAAVRRWWAAVVLGGLLGVSMLVNAQATLVAPVLLGWLAWRARRLGYAWLRPLGVCVAVASLLVLPWVARNALVFHAPVFIRSNFGAELALGFNAQTDGPLSHAALQDSLFRYGSAEIERYSQIGELAYMDEKEQAALTFITTHPDRAATLVVNRVFWTIFGSPDVISIFWLNGRFTLAKHIAYGGFTLVAMLGLLLLGRRRPAEACLLAMIIAVYLLPEVLVYPTERHRHVIEPLLTVLAIAPLLALGVRIRGILGNGAKHAAAVQASA